MLFTQQNSLRAIFVTLFSLVIACSSPITFAKSEEGPSQNSVTAKSPIKSPMDERDYEFVLLDNGLKVLLISDLKAEKSAASLDVWIGSGEDPKERAGLAHFLEHMLFLGTEKYPDPSEYQAFISANGGAHNAYTTLEHTNYYFDINPEKLDEALDRFSQFFVAPKFDEKYVDRERNAVDSEYRAKYQNEYLRKRDVLRAIVDPKSTLSNFTVGSLDTLSNENGNLRESLIEFYNKFYSADRMSLVVLGRESLADLKKRVLPKFKPVPKRNVILPEQSESIFLPGFLPAQVTVKPLQDIRQLRFEFPLPKQENYKTRSLVYISHLLAHEGKGSLLSLLKEKGWAQSLWSSEFLRWRKGRTFAVEVALTTLGEKHIDDIQSLMFYQLQQIKKHGIQKWRYDELKQQGRIGFQFKEKTDALREVRALASMMQKTAVEDVLRRYYLYEEFDTAEIKSLLKLLTPENSLRMLTSPDVETDLVSQYFEAPYSVKSGVDITLNPISELDRKALALPEKNVFLPKKFALKKGKSKKDAAPENIFSRKNMKVWFKRDEVYSVPRGDVRIRLKTPFVASSPKGNATARLFASALNDKLNEVSYMAAMAGSHFSISANTRGMDLNFSGYDDGLDDLIYYVLTELKKLKKKKSIAFDEGRFREIKADLIRKQNNKLLKTPYSRLLSQIPEMMYQPSWSTESVASALEEVSYEELNNYARQYNQFGRIEMLIYGNFTAKEAKKIAKKTHKIVLKKESIEPIPEARIAKLADDSKQLLRKVESQHQDNALVMYLQGRNDTVEEMAKTLLLSQVLSSPYYSDLRTEQQLGYIVSVSTYPLKKVPSLLFIVQSPKAPVEKLISATDEFLQSYKPEIAGVLERHKVSLLQSLREQPKNMGEQVGRYWYSISQGDYAFARRDAVITAMEKLNEEDMLNFYDELALSEKRRALFVAGDVKESMLSQYDGVDSTLAFKEKQPFYSYQ